MSQVTTNLQIDFFEWVYRLEHIFFFILFALRGKTNNFTHTILLLCYHMKCIVMLYLVMEMSNSLRGAGYQAILFHLVMQKAAEPRKRFFKRHQGCIPPPQRYLSWQRKTACDLNAQKYWCEQEHIAALWISKWSSQENMVSGMQDAGFYEQHLHGNKARSLSLCIQEIPWLHFHVYVLMLQPPLPSTVYRPVKSLTC